MINRKFLKLFNETYAFCVNDKDFIDFYNKEKRKEKFNYYLENAIMDYLSNYNLLDKEYLDISFLRIFYYGKKYLIDLDEIYQLFKETIDLY